MQELIGTKEASRMLGMASPATLSRWVQIGKITPVAKLTGRTGSYVFTREQIEAYRDNPDLDDRIQATA
jgi:predicted site-specific integrase-resolvase